MPDGPITLDASEVEETPSLSADQVEESGLTGFQASKQIDSVSRPQALTTTAPSSARLSLGPSPRSIAEGLQTEQEERRAGAPLVITPQDKVQSVPRPNQSLARPQAPDSSLNYAVPGNEVTGGVTGFFPSRTPRNGPGGQLPATPPLEAAKSTLGAIPPQSETELLPGAATELSAAQHLATPGERTRGASEAVQGIGEAVTPLMGPEVSEIGAAGGAALKNALRMGAGLGTGMGAQKAGEEISKALGASKDTQELVSQLSFWAPTILGMVGGNYEALPKDAAGRADAVFRNLVYKAGGTVPENATLEQATAAYKQAINNLHPDVSPATAQEAQILNAAWTAVKGRYKAGPPVAPPTRAELAEHLDRTNFESPEAAKASYVAEQQAQEAPVAAKPKAPEPEVIPPSKPSPAAPEVAKPIVLESNQVEEAKPKQQPRGKTEGTEPGAVGKPTARAEAKPELPSAAPVPEPSSEKTEAVTPAEPAAKPEIVKGGKVELADGRRATIEYAAPADKLPVVRLSTEDGEKVKLTSQKEIDQLKAATKYKYGSTQADIPESSEAHSSLESARARISDSDLAGKGKDVGGNHVTVRYGIQSEDVEGVKKYLASLAPFEASLGKTDKFPPTPNSDGAAVIHAPIESPELQKINAELEKHGDFTEPSFKEYKPHATIAYVDPAKAGRYTGMSVTEGKKFPVNEIAITDKQGNQTVVKLEGKKEPARTPTGRLLTPEELDVQNQPGTTGVAKDVDKWQPPPELGAFPNTPDVGAKARAQVDKESGPLKRGEERRKVDRTNQQAEDKLFTQARKELGEDASTEQIEKRIEELRKPAAATSNKDRFREVYARQLTKAIKEHPEEYSPGIDPQKLAEKMTESFVKGSANKDSRAVRATLKELGIKDTYAGIKEFLNKRDVAVSASARGSQPGEPTRPAAPESLELTPPPADMGVRQYISTLPQEQRKYAKAAWDGFDAMTPEQRSELSHMPHDQWSDEIGVKPIDYDLDPNDVEDLDHELRQMADSKPLDTEPTIKAGTNEPENQPARTAGETEAVPSVSEPARESGNAPADVPAKGNSSTPQAGETGRSVGQPDRERMERPARQPGERDEPARSGGSSPAEHPASERKGRGRSEARPTGADGRPVEAASPEEPQQAKNTTAELRNQRNFHISDEHAESIGAGGEITKIKGNLDALELLKKIQAEGREVATPEEQATLAKYVDFGGLVGMLQNWWKPEYAKHYERFQKILTQDEIQEIRETLPNTHYTSMEMVDWTWSVLKRLGFKGGRWLEPGMGIGNFVGRQPAQLSNRSEILGVERNPLTGAMAKLLYPDANIQIKPFQHFVIPNNTLDAAAGNVPFQDVAITDDPAYSKLKLNLHNYFIVKTLDKLKPGGIAALITSRYTMDNAKGSGYAARQEMAKRADLIAAIRLPDKAFKGNAATEVVADLLIFQKRDPNTPLDKMPDWTDLTKIKAGEGEFTISKYFVDHPEHVIGSHSDQGKMYRRGSYTVKAPDDFSKALQDVLETLPKGIYGKLNAGSAPAAAPPPSTLDSTELEFAPEDVKPGAFFKDEKGNVRIKQSGVGIKLPEELRSPEKTEHISRAIDLRDQLNRTIAVQLETSDDGALKAEQKKLEKLYDAYHKKYGSVHGPKLARLFADDPEYGKLLSLENLDTETKQTSKSDIFRKRTLAPYEPLRELPDDPKSAMLKVMAERGYLDTKLMADLLKKPERDVISDLEGKNLLFQDPQSGNYHTADEYLSGNVREKLKAAEHAAETDKRFARNVEELKKNQPKPLTIHEIQPNLGQTWVPTSIYESFVRHLAKARQGDVTVSRDLTGKWSVKLGSINRFNLENEWAGGGVAGHKLVAYALNQQQPTVYSRDDKGNPVLNPEATAAARDKLAAIKEEFRTVLRSAPDATVQKLETIYNDTFNGFKLREFDGEHLDFPGMSEAWRSKIRGYQKAAIWRILQEGRGGIFHAPGLGKTLTMAAAGMEARRLKLSRKNMYAVPNHMIPQWREDFKRFYPNANVLAVTDDDFTATNRAKLMSRIATGDWDAVVVPHSQFDLLPMSPEWESKTIEKRLADYRQVLEELDEKDDKRTIKQIEKAVDKLESRLNELNGKKKDNAINFDQLGIDMLFVDEAHAYKAMAVPSKMGNIGGLSNRASQRAFAMEMKADFLRDTHHGRGLVFGTGTPITNTVGELYVMTKYLAPEMLEAAGIRSFDDWAANFATTVTQFEYGADGVTFKPKTSLSEFVNVPELSTMFRRYAEYISKEQAKQLSNLKEPDVNRHDHMLKISPVQEPLLDWIAQRGDHLTKHPPRTKEERQADNWLKLSSDARKISLDPRLYDRSLHDDADSKANEAVSVIKKTLDGSEKERGTVAIFSDFFQHKNDAGKPDFNLFEDMRDKLVKQGVPKSEIAIIHEASSKEEKELLFSKVRAGKVRVIFGSTEKMGIGTNIQDRLKALLHLDQPWRPDQVEQREGRIQRSGNQWDKVDVHRFIAEPEQGTKKVWDPKENKEVEKPRPRAYDLQMYQQLARKAHFQEQFLTGNYNGRSMEDTGGEVRLNSQMFEVAKAMATGNPDAMRKVKVEHDLRTYGMLERSFQTQRSQQVREKHYAEMRLPIEEKRLELLKRDYDLWQKTDDGEKITIQVGDVTRDKDQIKKWLEGNPDIADLAGKNIKVAGIDTSIEQIFRKEMNPRTKEWEDVVEYRYSLAGDKHSVPFDWEKGVTHVKSFLNSFAQRARNLDGWIRTSEGQIAKYQSDMDGLTEQLKKQSPYKAKVDGLEKELDEIEKRMGLKKSGDQDEGIVAGEGDEETPEKTEEQKPAGKGLRGIHGSEAGFATPAALNPFEISRAIKQSYDDLIQSFIDKKLKLGDKYYKVKEYDPVIADTLHLVDNAPRYFREKAKANLDKALKGLSDDQVRLAHLLVDSDSRDDLRDNHHQEYLQATADPKVMAAVKAFEPLQREITRDRLSLGWPIRLSLHIEEDPASSNPFEVRDRQGNLIADFKTEGQAEKFVKKNATVEPHLKRTYPEHSKNPLPGDTGAGPFTGTFYADKGLRPPKMDKKSREMSAEYHYEHGRKDFSGYLESYAQTKEAVLKQHLFDELANEATMWKAGTAQPTTIKYNGKEYVRPDIAMKARKGGQTLEPYAVYDPSRGEKFLIKTPEWSTLTTGKPGIGPNDRYLAPKVVVDALERYDTDRGGSPSTLRKFFQEQIVGLFGPMVHVNNIIRHLGHATGLGAFDPRSWPSISRVILSPKLRERMQQGVDDATIDLLVKRGAYTSWSDIGNLNHYIGGNMNPLNWIRAFGKGVLFDPKFAGGWGGLDPKARVVIADYLKEHAGLGEQEIADTVNDALGNYNRSNWTERQKQIARFTLFPGWDTASAKWFLRHPFKVAIAGAMVVLAINLALKKLGKIKGDEAYDFAYIHFGDRKFRTGLLSDSMGEHFAAPLLSAAEAHLKGDDVAAGATQGLMKGTSSLIGQFSGPTVEMIADQVYNRQYAGGSREIVQPQDRYTPGTWAPNRELEKRIAFATLKGLPAINRFLAPKGDLDAKQGLGSVVGVSNYKYGAEERLKSNAARAMTTSQTLSKLAETEPEAAQKFVEDPNKAVYLTFNSYLSQMEKDLKELDTERQRVRLADMPSTERRTALDSIGQSREQLLSAADAINDQISQMKMSGKSAQK